MKIVLHIDRLVLRGINRADAVAVSAALQAELRQQLATQGSGALAAHAARPHMHVGQVQLAQGADSTALGQAVATRIAAGGRDSP